MKADELLAAPRAIRDRLDVELSPWPVPGIDSVFGRPTRASASILAVGTPRLTCSGSAAILLALQASGVGIGDRVLVPAYHCPTMIGPVAALGAQPVFYPIDAGGVPDPEAIRDALRERPAAAVLVAHLFGRVLPLAPLRALCDEHGASLIEDCAHAFFGGTATEPVGQVGDYAIASLPKFFPTLQGGLFTSARAERSLPALRAPLLADQLKGIWDLAEVGHRYRRFGRADRLLDPLVRLKSLLRARTAGGGRAHPEGRRVEADAAESATMASVDPRAGVSATQVTAWLLARADQQGIAAARVANYRRLAGLLAEHAGLEPLMPLDAEGCVPYVLPVRVAPADLAYRRLRLWGVPVMRWDYRWPGVPDGNDVASRWSREVLQLPCHQHLDDRALETIGLAVAAAVAVS